MDSLCDKDANFKKCRVISVPSELSGSSEHASLSDRAEYFKLFFQRVASSTSASAGQFLASSTNKLCQKSMKVKVTALINSLEMTFQKPVQCTTWRQLWKQVSNGIDKTKSQTS